MRSEMNRMHSFCRKSKNIIFKMSGLISLCMLYVVLTVINSQPLPTPPPLEPYNLQGTVDTARNFAANTTLTNPTGYKRIDYLKLIHTVVSYWKTQQAPTGAILDSVTGIEEQYSTPHYSWSCALLIQEKYDTTLLDSAALALDWSINSMYNGSNHCAQATCDFYAVPTMRSYIALRNLVDPSRANQWTYMLQNLNPNITYEFPGQNWELTAATGEWIRLVELGYNNQYANFSFWEQRIGRLATLGGPGFWNSNGQFQDNYGQPKTSPHAYDAFADAYTSLLLYYGYGNSTISNYGYYANYLSTLMSRAIYTHALFQSPFGEIPVGGRSGQHQWNEAVMAAQYEIYANYAYQKGDMLTACQLQRAAHLSLHSLNRWIRPDGAIQIVKNWFLNGTQRWGYEGYSFMSQYNLLPMGWLANAYTIAEPNDAIPECATIADVGGVAFALPYDTFRKIFAMAQGTFVEIMTGADPEYDSTGLYRIHFNRCGTSSSTTDCMVYSLLGPTAAPPLSSSTTVASALGVYWTFEGDTPGVYRTLANHTLQTVLAAVFTPGLTNTPELVTFTVQYVLWDDGVLVTEDYTVTPMNVTVTAGISLPGYETMFNLMVDSVNSATSQLLHPADKMILSSIQNNNYKEFLQYKPILNNNMNSTIASFGVQFPAMVYDGISNFTVSTLPCATTDPICYAYVSGNSTQGSIQYSVQQPATHTIGWNYANTVQLVARNGVISPLYASLSPVTTDAPSITYVISPGQYGQ